MCISATAAALLAAGTAASVGSSYMQSQAQQDQMEQYNREASERNRRISEQYAERQQRIYAAREQQEKLFQQLADQQDAEQERQRAFADRLREARRNERSERMDRRQDWHNQIDETLDSYANASRRRDAVAENAQARRDVVDKAGDFGVTAGYETSGSAAPEVVRDRVSDRAQLGAAEGRERADAMFRMSGFNDLNLGDRNLFRMLGSELDTTARNAAQSRADARQDELRLRQDAALSRQGYNASLVPIRARNDALNRAQQFYGSQGYGIPEPVFQQASTPFADIMGGLGDMSTTIGAQNLFTGSGGGNPSYLRGRTLGTVPPSDGFRG